MTTHNNVSGRLIRWRVLTLLVAVAPLGVKTSNAAEVELPEGVKCIVCDKAPGAEHSADWKDAKVYLACPNCVTTFGADPDEYAVRANAQLVATGQAKQVACPITGRKVKADRTVKVCEFDVKLCCVGCQGRAARVKGDGQLYLVFSNNAFAKGFKVTATRNPHFSSSRVSEKASALPKALAPFFQPPTEYANDFGTYRSPLKFYDGHEVKTAEDWKARRQEILKTWHGIMGEWPPLIEKSKINFGAKMRLEKHTRHRVEVEVAPEGRTVRGYLLVPHGEGPFPAVVVPYYDAETGAGKGKELRDFGFQLAKRGFVALAIGTPNSRYWPSQERAKLQPLSMLAYVAANCHSALATLSYVDDRRIGIVGHSYGGKWAMFASCLYDKFACAAWSDGGIVFDEKRSNVNYWEPWYLGYDRSKKRREGIPTDDNPSTGAYKTLVEKGRDLLELHALMAPRPFLVSGGSEDRPERWKALNHAIAVNKLLGYENRVAMTNRRGHSPTQESNEQLYSFFEHFLKAKP